MAAKIKDIVNTIFYSGVSLDEHIVVQKRLTDITKPVNVLYLSSYIPRKCGIATFTKDLTNAMNLINPLSIARILAFDNPLMEKIDYPPEVVLRIRENEKRDYQKAVRFINRHEEVDVVCLEHEFGLFGCNNGEKILELIKGIDKPIVSTFHTILKDPSEEQKRVIQEIGRRSTYMIAMLGQSVKTLKEIYNLPTRKMVVIPHGVPDFPRANTQRLKRKFRLEGKVVMASSNLLSPVKGIELAIRSIPEIIEKVPNFLYLVLGETHPVYIKDHGNKDEYRELLVGLTKKLGITKHVKFVNRYLSLQELINYVGACDYYVTPYLDPQQSASGALAYAIGAGKTCISTPYPYAKEMLSRGRGTLVPFKDSGAIAKAVIDLELNPDKKQDIEEKAYEMGRTMTWNSVAHQYYHLFHFAL